MEFLSDFFCSPRKINMLNPKMIWWMVQMIFPFQFRVIFRFELLYEKTLCWKKHVHQYISFIS